MPRTVSPLLSPEEWQRLKYEATLCGSEKNYVHMFTWVIKKIVDSHNPHILEAEIGD